MFSQRVPLVLLCGLAALGSQLAVVPRAAASASQHRPSSADPHLQAGDGSISGSDVVPLKSARAARSAGPSVPKLGSFVMRPGRQPKTWKPNAEGYVEGESEVIGGQTNATHQSFDNPDGTVTEEITPAPIRFQDAHGDWTAFDTDLVPMPTGRLAGQATPPGDSVASKASGTAPLVSVGTDAGEVSLVQPAARVVEAKVVGGDAVFPDGLTAERDLEVGLTPHGFESTVVVGPRGAGANRYTEDLVVPPGVHARPGGPGVELVDGQGIVIGTYGSGTASDAADLAGETDVATRLVEQVGTRVTVENVVDPDWLGSRQRVFPVRIDPFFSASTSGSGSIDTYVQTGITTPQSGATTLRTGAVYGSTSTVRRALLRFDLGGVIGPRRAVLSATLDLKTTYSPSCAPKTLTVRSLTASPTMATNWANQPTFGATTITPPAFAKGYSASCPAGTVPIDVTPLVQRWVDGSANNGLAVLASDESDGLAGKYFDAAEGATPPTLSVTYDNLPSNGMPAIPLDAASVATTQPRLTITPGTDVDSGDALKYWFTVSSDPDGSGQVLSSGWLSSTSWDVPSGSLVDGQTYYWTVSTWDGVSLPAAAPPSRSFKVDMRLGDSGNWPMDEEGSAKVNLTNGNLVVNIDSPSYPSLGGDVGASLTYNSKAEPTAGLTGSYYDLSVLPPSTHAPDPDDVPELVRRDPVMAFAWGTKAPWSQMPSDNYYVKWTGLLTAPTTGTYSLGIACNDGAKVTLNSTVRVDRWSGCGAGTNWSASMGFTAGNTMPITVEYWEGTGSASVDLQVRGPGLDAGGVDVPSSWLSTATPSVPVGWGLSADVDGTVAYRSAEMSATAVVFTDAEGTAHRYAWDVVKGAWQPPPGEHGVVGTDDDRDVTLLDEDGQTYTFGPTGNLLAVESASDDAHPSAHTFTWSGAVPKLTAITDPVSDRAVRLSYSGSANCPVRNGFAAPPPGMLCAINDQDFFPAADAAPDKPVEDYTTQLRYNAAGQLVRVENPGHEITDLAYDEQGRLDRLRDPLAVDAIATGVRSDSPTNPTETVFSYDTSGRLSSVRLPEPQPGEARPEHTYDYSASGSASVSALGLTSATGKLQQVRFDAAGRITDDIDQAGRVSHTAWDSHDRAISTWDDATGLKSTTVYDDLGNATDTWGPAPTGWWPSPAAGGLPTAANQAATPHEHAGFDEGLQTLSATWWPNSSFAGPPTAHSTGINAATPLLYNSWGSAAPEAFGASSPARFSGRITGWVNIANTSPYVMELTSLVGTARMYVDNTLVIDASSTSSTTSSGTFTPVSAGWKPVTIEYADTGPTASFGWWWRQGTSSHVRVPASALQPGYGLQTSSADADGHVTTTSYGDGSHHIDPYLGIATTTTTDPGTGAHANLISTVSVEDPTVGGYLRETSHTLPSGPSSAVSTSNWGHDESATVPCPGGSNANQAGQVKAVEAADPDGVGGTDPIVRESVYDDAGRVAASRVVADGANWTCTSYDRRGRTVKVVVPDLPDASGRTTKFDHMVSGNPLASSVSDTTGGGTVRIITTVIDLLGQVRSYTDAWSRTTTTTYDQVGREISTVSALGTETTTYDPTGVEGPTVLDGATYATPHYDGAGRLSWVEYSNGTRSEPVSRDVLGRETSSMFRKVSDGSVLSSDAVSLSVGGDVTAEVADGNDPHPGAPDYLYDGVGRLTEAWTTVRDAMGAVSSRHTAYGFGAPDGCTAGAAAATGANSNRTSQTVGDGAGAVVISSCYDAADRLMSTTEPGVGPISYDRHGNTTAIWGETRNYDASDRHLSTVKGSTRVDYVRDASDRIIGRTSASGAGTPDVEHYGFTGGGDSPDFVMDGSGSVLERDLGLPGGVSLVLRSGSQVWSYPNIHGDVTVVTDGAGVKQGPTRTYDGFGNATGQPIVDNSAGSFDYGMLGEHQRPVEHEAGLAVTVEMGARQYDPVLGRFLEVDPVDGGSANDYDYVNADPINGTDLNGASWHCRWCRPTYHWRHSRWGGHGRHHSRWHHWWQRRGHQVRGGRTWVNHRRGSLAWRVTRNVVYGYGVTTAWGAASAACIVGGAFTFGTSCALGGTLAAITTYQYIHDTRNSLRWASSHRKKRYL